MRRDTHWKCLILTLLIYACLAAITWCRLTVVTKKVTSIYDGLSTQISQASPCDDGYIYIPVAFVVMLYLVYLVECWHSHTRIQLQYKVDGNMVYERVRSMREALPIIWWKAVCYHYVRRTRQVTRYRNGDAFTTTQVYYERVNSHAAGSAFNFSNCGVKDVSRVLVGLDLYPATKIRFTKGFSFAAFEAECEFEDQRAQFFQENERRDDYMESQEGMDLLNVHFKEYMIAFADPENLPWYVSHIIFWIASMLLLSWPLRVIIEYKTAYVHLHVHKLFGTNYLDSSIGGRGGELSRVSTMGSSEMEMTIRNNYAIVPSYSEALLIQPPPDGPYQSSYLLRRLMPDANGNMMTPMRSYTFSSLSNVLPARSRGSTYIRGSCSNGYLSGTTRDARPSNCITANQGDHSLVSIAHVPSVEDQEEENEEENSPSVSDCGETDGSPPTTTHRHNSRQQRRRRRKRAKNPSCVLNLAVDSSLPAAASTSTHADTTTTPSSSEMHTNSNYFCQSSSPSMTPLGHIGHDTLVTTPLGHTDCTQNVIPGIDPYCVIVNSSAVAALEAEAAASSSIADSSVVAISDDNPYANATFITSSNHDQNEITSPISPVSPHMFQDQNLTLFNSSAIMDPVPYKHHSNSSRKNTNNHMQSSSIENSNMVERNPIYSNATDAFTNPMNNVSLSSNCLLSCNNGCPSGLPSEQLHPVENTLESTSVDFQQQRLMQPANTGAITVVVMDTTQRQDSSVELVNMSSVQKQQQQQQKQQQLTLRPYLSRKKQSSSGSSSSSSGINSGGDIKSNCVGGGSYSNGGGMGSSGRRGGRGGASYSVEDGANEFGACTLGDKTQRIPPPQSPPTGVKPDLKSTVDKAKHHLWGRHRRGPSLLGQGRNSANSNSYSTSLDCNEFPSSSGLVQSQPPVWIANSFLDPTQNGRHTKCSNHHGSHCNPIHSPSSWRQTQQSSSTSQQEEPDPPPCYEDALWMQRLTPVNRHSDGDYRNRSTSLSTSRNERPHRTIQLMETSL